MSTTTFSPLLIQQGIIKINGQPRLFISADYPYYRDDPRNWPDRLASLQSLGINAVSAYIPWRHHQLSPDTAPDFTGRTQPNRDILGFLALCSDIGLPVIAKPGPFIHGETNYGGLPDWVCPLNHPAIEPLQDSQGEFPLWSGGRLDESGTAPAKWPLPAPFDPEFLRLAREWMCQVGAEVIGPHQAPAGPIVAIQVANEGIYSNGQHAPWAYDYSPSALASFRSFLAEKYQSIERYNHLHGTAHDTWEAILPPHARVPSEELDLLDWGEFSTCYTNKIFQAWSEPLGTHLPILLNQNPPLGVHYGLDAWFSRVEPERWPAFHYGFTNWVGDVSANSSAFHRYVMTAKRLPGPNMEENWGFAELYDPAYIDAATSFYQTLVILNNGATGFNIYTGVGTSYPDTNLEVIPKAPYPDAAPITATGELTPKAEIVRWMVNFFQVHGVEFLACRSAYQPAAWGLYTPLARIAAWSPEGELAAPQHGAYFADFQRQMRKLHLDYGLVNLETTTLEDLLGYPHLFIACSDFMAEDIQLKLAHYIRQGGKLNVCGIAPHLDEAGEPCKMLSAVRKSIQVTTKVNAVRTLAGVPRPQLLAGEADVWVRSHPERDVHFITILIPAHGAPHARLKLRVGEHTHLIELSAAPSGGAILRVVHRRITDVIVNGHNGYLGHTVPPQCTLGNQTIGLDTPGDYIRIGDWEAHLAPQSVTG